MNKLSGFTLIELLVVIAILGILASVVLSNVNTARQKGVDAAIKQTITNMRGEAELYYDENGDYINMCDDPVISGAINKANELNKAGSVTCVDGNDVTGRWAIESQLVASTTQYYCVDNGGTSDIYTGSTISNITGSEDAVCGP